MADIAATVGQSNSTTANINVIFIWTQTVSVSLSGQAVKTVLFNLNWR
ncbi:MAG: hypothetical protein CM15mV27_1480 [Caudoviricetes sp.]|nr:MAG: hypothetical protein CM15mV27_1480 [Caudoviricetes sp.]